MNSNTQNETKCKVLTWGLGSQITKKFLGENPGHASIELTNIPYSKARKNYIQQLKKAGVDVREMPIRSANGIATPSWNVYFSVWPDKGKKGVSFSNKSDDYYDERKQAPVRRDELSDDNESNLRNANGLLFRHQIQLAPLTISGDIENQDLKEKAQQEEGELSATHKLLVKARKDQDKLEGREIKLRKRINKIFISKNGSKSANELLHQLYELTDYNKDIFKTLVEQGLSVVNEDFTKLENFLKDKGISDRQYVKYTDLYEKLEGKTTELDKFAKLINDVNLYDIYSDNAVKIANLAKCESQKNNFNNIQKEKKDRKKRISTHPRKDKDTPYNKLSNYIKYRDIIERMDCDDTIKPFKAIQLALKKVAENKWKPAQLKLEPYIKDLKQEEKDFLVKNIWKNGKLTSIDKYTRNVIELEKNPIQSTFKDMIDNHDSLKNMFEQGKLNYKSMNQQLTFIYEQKDKELTDFEKSSNLSLERFSTETMKQLNKGLGDSAPVENLIDIQFYKELLSKFKDIANSNSEYLTQSKKYIAAIKSRKVFEELSPSSLPKKDSILSTVKDIDEEFFVKIADDMAERKQIKKEKSECKDRVATLVDKIQLLQGTDDNYDCVGKGPDSTIVIPLKEKKDDDNKLDLDEALKEMVAFTSDTPDFSLYDNNCSKAVSRILKKGICNQDVFSKTKPKDSWVNFVTEIVLRRFLGQDEAEKLSKGLSAYTPDIINTFAKNIVNISETKEVPNYSEQAFNFYNEFSKVKSAYLNSIDRKLMDKDLESGDLTTEDIKSALSKRVLDNYSRRKKSIKFNAIVTVSLLAIAVASPILLLLAIGTGVAYAHKCRSNGEKVDNESTERPSSVFLNCQEQSHDRDLNLS